MKITKAYRYEFRDALIEKGVPDVIAVMASEAVQVPVEQDSVLRMIIRSFHWASTPQGNDFWAAVYSEAGGILP